MTNARVPLATEQHCDRVMSYFDIAPQDGANTRTGGTRYGDHGFFVADPARRSNSGYACRPGGDLRTGGHADELHRHRRRDHAGQPLSTAHRLADGIDAGTVWVNTYGEMTTGPMPFARFTHSRLGGEGGPEVMDAFTQNKAVLIAL